HHLPKRRAARLPLRLAQLPLDLAGRLPPADRLALVVDVLPARECDLDLRPRAPIGEVDAGGDEGEATLLGAADQALDLAAVKQQLARAFGIVVVPGSRPVRWDVHPDQPYLAVTHRRVGVLQLRPGFTQPLPRGPGALSPALARLKAVVGQRGRARG